MNRDGAFYRDMHAAQRGLLLKYLGKADGRVSLAARIAEVDENHFRRLMRQHGMAPPGARKRAPTVEPT